MVLFEDLNRNLPYFIYAFDGRIGAVFIKIFRQMKRACQGYGSIFKCSREHDSGTLNKWSLELGYES
jgi:hypothetical protein